MANRIHHVSKLSDSRSSMRSNADGLPTASSLQQAELLAICDPGMIAEPGSVYGEGIHVDLKWHYHDMHKLLYAFEGATEIESARGRNLIPRQLAAWVPAGVPHCSSIHGIRWVSVLFPVTMVNDCEQRVRTIMVSGLMREMMREAMRWPIRAIADPLRTSFFETMARFCGEWISNEANLFLPTSNDARVQRALNLTSQRMDLKLLDICAESGLSVRTLRRHLGVEIGMTWEEYRQRSRLLHAVSMLSETEQPVSEIAAQCGFESPSAFAKTFRLAMGEAPRDYRNRVTPQ